MIASKNWTLNATAMVRKKFGGGLTGQSRTSTPWKFDSVSRRNSTAPGSNAQEAIWEGWGAAPCYFISRLAYLIFSHPRG